MRNCALITRKQEVGPARGPQLPNVQFAGDPPGRTGKRYAVSRETSQREAPLHTRKNVILECVF